MDTSDSLQLSKIASCIIGSWAINSAASPLAMGGTQPQSRSMLSGRIFTQPLRAGTNEGTGVRDAIYFTITDSFPRAVVNAAPFKSDFRLLEKNK